MFRRINAARVPEDQVEPRLAALAERAAAKLPLFDGPRNDRARLWVTGGPLSGGPNRLPLALAIPDDEPRRILPGGRLHQVTGKRHVASGTRRSVTARKPAAKPKPRPRLKPGEAVWFADTAPGAWSRGTLLYCKGAGAWTIQPLRGRPVVRWRGRIRTEEEHRAACAAKGYEGVPGVGQKPLGQKKGHVHRPDPAPEEEGQEESGAGKGSERAEAREDSDPPGGLIS